MVLELKLDVNESLAREVERLGLLESSEVEQMLREELKRRRTSQFFEAADKLSVQTKPLTEKEITAEIKAV